MGVSDYVPRALQAGEVCSLEEYISRSPPGQNKIYYLSAPSRRIAEASPYLEGFAKSRTEVLFLYNTLDDFVMHSVGKFGGRDMRSAESGNLDLPPAAADAEKKAAEVATPAAGSAAGGAARLSDAQIAELGTWLSTKALPKKVSAVKATTRLNSTPALLTDTESAPLRRMNRLLDGTREADGQMSYVDHLLSQRQTLEINPAHPLIVALHREMTRDEALATLVAEQVRSLLRGGGGANVGPPQYAAVRQRARVGGAD